MFPISTKLMLNLASSFPLHDIISGDAFVRFTLPFQTLETGHITFLLHAFHINIRLVCSLTDKQKQLKEQAHGNSFICPLIPIYAHAKYSLSIYHVQHQVARQWLYD